MEHLLALFWALLCGARCLVLVGTSRGFAFVEFNQLPEAVRWMEVNQVANTSAYNPSLSRAQSASGERERASGRLSKWKEMTSSPSNRALNEI